MTPPKPEGAPRIDGPCDASNEPIEVKLIAAASDGMVRVTPEKCERIRRILAAQPAATAGKASGGEMSYAIKVIDNDGDEVGFLCDGMSDMPTRYTSKQEAKEFADFMRIGMDETIIVVPYPKRRFSVRPTPSQVPGPTGEREK